MPTLGDPGLHEREGGRWKSRMVARGENDGGVKLGAVARRARRGERPAPAGARNPSVGRPALCVSSGLSSPWPPRHSRRRTNVDDLWMNVDGFWMNVDASVCSR